MWGAFEYEEMLEAGKVEVKTCEPSEHGDWRPRITDVNSRVIADALVFVGMVETYNPCNAQLFVIPKDALLAEVARQLAKNPAIIRPRVTISKNRVNNNTGRVNRWYEFELPNHSRLKQRITEYVHGDFNILPEQMSLF